MHRRAGIALELDHRDRGQPECFIDKPGFAPATASSGWPTRPPSKLPDDVLAKRGAAAAAAAALLETLVAAMRRAADVEPGRRKARLGVYAGDGLVMLALMRALAVLPSPRRPHARYALVFEVYRWRRDLYARLLYADAPVEIPGVAYAATLDGLGLCRLDDLADLLERRGDEARDGW